MIRRGALAAVAALALAGPAAGDDAVLTPARLNTLTLAELTPCNGEIAAVQPPLPESELLAGEADVRRRGRTLVVGRARFREIPFREEDVTGESHAYLGRYAAAPIVLLSVVAGEGWGYTLVDPASGSFVEVAGLPMPGPDGHTFVGVTREEDYHAPAVEIVEWREGRLTLTSLWMRACGFDWAGPDRITYRLGFDGHGEGSIDREAGVWVVHSREPPTDAPSAVQQTLP